MQGLYVIICARPPISANHPGHAWVMCPNWCMRHDRSDVAMPMHTSRSQVIALITPLWPGYNPPTRRRAPHNSLSIPSAAPTHHLLISFALTTPFQVARFPVSFVDRLLVPRTNPASTFSVCRSRPGKQRQITASSQNEAHHCSRMPGPLQLRCRAAVRF